MKKIILLMVIWILSINVFAQDISITTVNKSRIVGNFILNTDTTICVKPSNIKDTIAVPISVVSKAIFENGNYLEVREGKFVLITKEEIKANAIAQEAKRMGDPNYAVGKAMKKVGKSSLLIGIPSLCVGTILIGYGLGTKLVKPTMPKISEEFFTSSEAQTQFLKDMKKYTKELTVYEDKLKTLSNYANAGFVLMPTGAALTIVGIPLVIEGKKLMEMQVNYNGNGIGLALNF